MKQYEAVSSFKVSLSAVDAQKHELRKVQVSFPTQRLLPSSFSERGEESSPGVRQPNSPQEDQKIRLDAAIPF